MTYMARCPGKCSAFAANSGNIWFKIDQSGYDASFAVPWASKRLYTQNRYDQPLILDFGLVLVGWGEWLTRAAPGP